MISILTKGSAVTAQCARRGLPVVLAAGWLWLGSVGRAAGQEPVTLKATTPVAVTVDVRQTSAPT